MEIQAEKKEFNFNENIKNKITEETSNPNILKNIRFAAFLMLGGLAVGSGFGVTNGLMQGYKVNQESKSRISEIIAKNQEIIKAKQNEINAVIVKAKNENEVKLAQLKKIQEEKIQLEIDKKEYGIWLANKDDMIHNYENQLLIYDQAYQTTMKGVKDGVLGLDQLANVREFYQIYKKNIHEYITYINETTVSFDHYRSLNEENRNFIKGQLLKYQGGDLSRSSDLETVLMNNFNKTDNDPRNIADLRNKMRNEMIDNLAEIMNNNHENTKTKKLKM